LHLVVKTITVISLQTKKSRFEFWPKMKIGEVCMNKYYYKVNMGNFIIGGLKVGSIKHAQKKPISPFHKS